VNPLLVSLIGVLLVPLFVGKWRVSVVGLGAQGVLMAWLAYRMHPHLHTVHEWLTLVDLGLVRGLLVPALLYGALSAERAPARSDIIPPNLLSWTIALGVVLVSFNFAGALVPENGDAQMLVTVAVTALLLGFLILASQSGHVSQIIGALRIENAIAIFELGREHHHEALAFQVGEMGLAIATVFLYRGYVRSLMPSRPREESIGGPTL
jgi:hydrogenase-4 membrane subunit HyfE